MNQTFGMADATANLETRRLTASEIFDAVTEIAGDELKRSPRALAFSGLAGGLTMGLTGLAVASVQAMLTGNPLQDLVSRLVYPIGFIAVIIGRAQLFTENTLYPVVLVLDERKHFRRLFRLWAIVFFCNVAGSFCFAVLAIRSGALHSEIAERLVHLGTVAASGSSGHLFWSGIIGGWLIALVAWQVTASHWTIGQIAMVWLLTFVVGAGKFAHCIAGSGEILSSVVAGVVPVSSYFHWLLFATLGNIVGGVFIVSLLNYGQVRGKLAG